MENLFCSMSTWEALMMCLIVVLFYAAPFAFLIPLVHSLTNWSKIKRIPLLKNFTMSYWIFLVSFPALLFVVIYKFHCYNNFLEFLLLFSPYIVCLYYYLIVRNWVRKLLKSLIQVFSSVAQVLFVKESYTGFFTFKLKNHENK